MSLPSPTTQDSFFNSPFVNYMIQLFTNLQNQHIFSRERLLHAQQNFLLSVGFSLLLYCLLHIQIVFLWFIKFIFYIIYQILWLIFCFPIKTLGLIIPNTLGYDILFPLFWLCSVASFYISKNIHENLWQFFEKQIVERYKLIKYQTNKREEVRRNLFLISFVVLLLLQSLLILLPITQSIKYNRQQTEKSLSLTNEKQPVVQSIPETKNVDSSSASFKERYYNRFIDAFKDEREQISNRNDKNQDEEEVTLENIQKQKSDEQRSTFERWLLDPLRSMFDYDYKDNFDRSQDISQSDTHQIDGQYEKNEQLVESSSMIDEHEHELEEEEEDDDDDDDDDDKDDHDDCATDHDKKLDEKSKKSSGVVRNLGQSFRNLFRYQSSSSKQEEPIDVKPEEDQLSSSIRKPTNQPEYEQSSNSMNSKYEQSPDKKQDQTSLLKKTITKSKREEKSSSQNVNDEIMIESDQDNDESSSIFDRMKRNFVKPFENAAQHLFDKGNSAQSNIKQFEDPNNLSRKKISHDENNDQPEDSAISHVKSLKTFLKKDKINDRSSKKKEKKDKPKRTTKTKTNFPLTSRKSWKSKKNPHKLNGWFEDPWNVWHLDKTKLSQIYTSKSKHARHFPRPNTTSIYVAFTDLECFDYRKKRNLYRVVKNPHLFFLNSYRQHSPFPVYISVLKSNGPQCYRFYPDSTCGILFKSKQRNIFDQLYRFVRFWFVCGLIIGLIVLIYRWLINHQQTMRVAFDLNNGFDRLTDREYRSSMTSLISTGSNRRRTIPINENIRKQLEIFLTAERNEGFCRLSGITRAAINKTFLNQRERISVETLQFIKVDIHHLNQYDNSEESPDKMVINAAFELDHLRLHMIQTFKEQTFSFEAAKLTGQLHVLLFIQQNQYWVEANLRQVRLTSPKLIDPHHVFAGNETQALIKLIEENIQRTTVQCSFQMAENQQSQNQLTSTISRLDSNKTDFPVSSTTLKTPTTPVNSPVSPMSPSSYRSLESSNLPVLVEQRSSPFIVEPEPKRLIIRVVKAVKLHDVEQPYCILELNHPKQTYKTSIANNGVNPFWDERFPFECDEMSNQIRLKIIDRRYSSNQIGHSFVDVVYADVMIPFAYATSTVYKEDIQISPQYPESIIRVEFSTLTEEEALAADSNLISSNFVQNFPTTTTNYDSNPISSNYVITSKIYDEQDYGATLPRISGNRSTGNLPEPTASSGKPQKAKSFMSSLKHLTLPRRKSHQKDRSRDASMSSQASSVSQVNVSVPIPGTNLTGHSLSSAALPGQNVDFFPTKSAETAAIRRSRSISRSFRNLFRSSSKKKLDATKKDVQREFDQESRNYLSTSSPTSKKFSFLSRRKSKQQSKQQQSSLSTNSLMNLDYSRSESARDTPVRANVGYPVGISRSSKR